MPGLAAGKEIFRNICLPKDQFETHVLEWLIPEKKEPLQTYAERMAAGVVHKGAVLVGVSFGGVVAQEMAQFLQLRKLIVVSSVKDRSELPWRLTFARRSCAYRLIPTRILADGQNLVKFAVGPRSRKRLRLYQEFLHVRNKRYLDWAIKNMVCWQRCEPLENIVHIHGSDDVVFPLRNIKNCTVVAGGTHIMLLTKSAAVTAKIIEAIKN
ncbi:MAG: alpha/beta fold hydrolase [Marinirhabdus sp.]